jgi:hypothetical protein
MDDGLNSLSMGKLPKPLLEITRQDEDDYYNASLTDKQRKIHDEIVRKYTDEAKEKNKNIDKSKKTINVQKIEQKVNDLLPLTMPVQIFYRDKATQTMTETTLLFAVKTQTHVVPTDEMVHQIGVSMRDNRFVFRMVQWTTGEISFWKDLVFNIDKLKADATSDKISTNWFYKLKLNAKTATVNISFKREHLLPTTTLVMTVDEVEAIKRAYGVNLQSTKDAFRLCKLFHLLGFMVIDSASETLWVYDDNDKKFDRTTIPSEQRENDSVSKKDMMKSFSAMINTGGTR